MWRVIKLHQTGLTVVELLLALTVIAGLIVLAAPSLLGHLDKAHESEAKQQLALAYRAASTGTAYPEPWVLASQLGSTAPGLRFAVGSAGTNEDPTQVFVDALSGGSSAVLHNQSRTGQQCTLKAQRSELELTCEAEPRARWAPQLNGPGPSVSGEARVGRTLTANPGHWSDQPEIAYRWARCPASGSACAYVGDERTYALTAAEVGQTMKVTIMATNSQGSGSDYAFSPLVRAS